MITRLYLNARLYLNVCLTILCINLLGDYCAAHVTVIGAHAFAVAQITTINSVYKTILSLRFLYRVFEATPCSVLNNNTLSIYTARTIRQKIPNFNKTHTQPSSSGIHRHLSYRQKRMKVNYARFHHVRNGREEDYDDAGAIVARRMGQ